MSSSVGIFKSSSRSFAKSGTVFSVFAAAVFVGNLESLGDVFSGGSYSVPVNIFTVWSHPTTVGYTGGEILLGVGVVLFVYAVVIVLILREIVSRMRARGQSTQESGPIEPEKGHGTRLMGL